MATSTDQSREYLGKHGNKFEELAKDFEAPLQDGLAQAADVAHDLLEQGKKAVQKNPGIALAAGFGAGILLGMWLSRRD